MAKGLFFIAIIPPAPIALEITGFKKFCQEKFQSERALRSPAHITLVPPFQYDLQRVHEIESLLAGFVHGQKPFFLTFDGFGHFRDQVVYVRVENSRDLDNVQSQLKKVLAHKIGHPDGEHKYHPHATIAFRDLDRNAFKLAWEHFKDQAYYRVFEMNAINLLRHNGSVWDVFRKFNLKS